MTFTPDELRIIGISGPTWIRMLESREQRLISRIYGEFRNGKTDHLATLAELACVKDQIHEIKTAINQNNQQKGDLHGE